MGMGDNSQGLPELLGALVDGTLREDQIQALARILREDARARAFYGKYMDLHVMLEWQLDQDVGPLTTPTTTAAANDVQGDGDECAAPCAPCLSQKGKPTPDDEPVAQDQFLLPGVVQDLLKSGMDILSASKLGSLFAALLITAGLVVAIMVFGSHRTVNESDMAGKGAPRPAPPVGYVMSSVEVNWSGPVVRKVGVGQPLVLTKGLVTIAMANGMAVTMQGPARFQFTSASSGKLAYGRMTVNVSRSTTTFRLATPSCEIVDLGTEFGVRVQGDGTANVQVYEGSVAIESYGKQLSDQRMAKKILAVGDAARIDGRTGAIRTTNPRSEQIARAEPLAGDFVRSRRVLVKDYKYETTPRDSARDWKFSYPDKSGMQLIDGVEGTAVFFDNYWVGTRDPMYQPAWKSGDSGTPQPRIDLALTRPQTISGISIVYLVDHIAGIHAPDRLQITLSTTEDYSAKTITLDTDKFTDTDTETETDPGSKGQVHILRLPFAPTTAQYVRLDFLNDGEWTFLSEIAFVGY